MSRQGVNLLPPAITITEAMEIFELLSKTNLLIGQLKSEFKHSLVSQSMMSVFSLKESVQSTRIEGTQITFTEMIEPRIQETKETQEVKKYLEALNVGMERIHQGYPVTTRLIKELHSVLMDNGARGTVHNSGEFRKIQNHIGPDNKIEHATYIPIPANQIDEYMSNLEYFINGTAHESFIDTPEGYYRLGEKSDVLIRIAIAHAQFESIHPFLDGNGRLGRILIALLAMKEGIVDSPIFLISEELERERLRYYNLLNGVRGETPNWYPWLKFFVESTRRMAERLLDKLAEADALANRGCEILKKASTRRVWLYSFSQPILTRNIVSKQIGLSVPTVAKCLQELVDAGLLFTDSESIKPQKYINYDLIRILDN